jgi:phospholipid/cholesterol/gamma-HCH transport system substrate-binding protein
VAEPVRPGHRKRLPNAVVGVIIVIVVLIASVLAFTKKLPWGDGYEVQAVFTTAQNIRPSSPVRIAGVNVGEVTEVRQLQSGDDELAAALGKDAARAAAASDSEGQQAAVVTMQIEEEGRPIKQDASFQLRPRLFLEGNLFVDTRPGSPGAPEAPDGHTFPLDQTSVSVQLDQVLTTLQSDVRADLQVFLDEFGAALSDHGGAEGFQEIYRSSPGAYRATAQVNEALLGTEPHDLSGFIRNFDRVANGLSRNEEQLKGLVTNFRVFAGSFAAESAALERAIRILPGVLRAAGPAFRNLNAAFPSLRAFAREALPGVRSTSPTLDAATPFLHQVRKLASRRELRGLAADLRPTIPRLAKLARRTLPFLDQSRALSSCFNEVVIPWSNDQISVSGGDYPHSAVGPVYKETGYALTGISGESRSGDANGQYIRVQPGGGTNTVVTPPDSSGEQQFGVIPFDILGSAPNISDSSKTRFAPTDPCERQEPPNLTSSMGPAPQQPASAGASGDQPEPIAEARDTYLEWAEEITRAAKQHEQGEDRQARTTQRGASRDYGEFLEQRWPRLQGQIRALGGSR